ncbi:hypothetical protein GCM10009530_40980 [Microbispora corallina]|uniref:HTH cro/C1-type domain-containing protein n=1 Tax=Microbispora corallina TaxID=83302 RepID=A0ABQ4GA47_9ACTN|nr:helix-turn-helix transcriptional regulator [Microbispora corallina]GIH43884.1 hypothetical protein Mco01_68840 [Microbispora corallina]
MANNVIDPSPEDEDLGHRLRRLRRSAGMSQQRLARELGLSAHSSIVYYESGRRIPPADIVDAYERVFALAPGTLHRSRLRALAARADLASENPRPSTPGRAPTADQPEPARSPETVSAPGRVSSPEAVPDAASPPETAPEPAQRGRPTRRTLLALVNVALLAMTTAATVTPPSSGATLDPTWTSSTQNVTDRAERSDPEPMDGDDPRARGCYPDALTLQTTPLTTPDGHPFGTLRLRESRHCGTVWGSAYYRNPDLYTVRITVHRPSDGATVRSDWSNDTPPGSYSDMLSTGNGCAWVEAIVITPGGTSRPAASACRT